MQLTPLCKSPGSRKEGGERKRKKKEQEKSSTQLCAVILLLSLVLITSPPLHDQSIDHYPARVGPCIAGYQLYINLLVQCQAIIRVQVVFQAGCHSRWSPAMEWMEKQYNDSNWSRPWWKWWWYCKCMFISCFIHIHHWSQHLWLLFSRSHYLISLYHYISIIFQYPQSWFPSIHAWTPYLCLSIAASGI